MKKIPVIVALLTACLFGYSFIYAQGSISGDSLCGATAKTACNLSHLKSIVSGVMGFIIGLGLPLLIVIIAYRFIMAWFAAAQGQTGAYKEATKKAGQAVLGFIILVMLFGGALLVVLEYLGATDPVLKLLKLISSSGLIETASAQEAPLLPSPIGETDLYGFILKLLSLVMRFFVYPALIVIWVATGFSFVLAQGKPEALSKAKKLLMWATISTFIVVMIQAFLIAARGTVEQVLPGSTASQSQQQVNQQAVTDNASRCQASGGVLAQDGVTCNPGTSRAGTRAADFCVGKTTGTLCSIDGQALPGICKRDTVVGCFRANTGDTCISAGGQTGVINNQGVCFFSRTLIQDGGSCRLSSECTSGICSNSVCVSARPKTGSGGSCQIAEQCASGTCLPTGVCQ